MLYQLYIALSDYQNGDNCIKIMTTNGLILIETERSRKKVYWNVDSVKNNENDVNGKKSQRQAI